MEIILVNVVGSIEGPMLSVSFGINTRLASTRLIEMFEYMSQQPRDHELVLDSVLIQSLIDPYAFKYAKETATLRNFLAIRSSEMNFRHAMDPAAGLIRKIFWPPGLVVNITKIGLCSIKKVYKMFLNNEVSLISS